MENKELGLNQSPYKNAHEQDRPEQARFNKEEFETNGRFGLVSDTDTQKNSRKSWPQMGKKMWEDVAHLSSKEAQLLGVETKQKLHDIKQGGIRFTLASVFTLTALHLFAAAVVTLLTQSMGLWTAALVTGAFFLVIGGLLFAGFQKKVNSENLTPKRFFRSLRHFSDLIKEKRNELLRH